MNDLFAKKLRIVDILNSSYFKEAGMNPNYLIFNEIKVFRVNVIGTLVGLRIEENEAELDDSTGMILLKSFEQKNIFETFNIGDLVLVIGKPREFGSKYIVPEIIKKTSIEWLKIRKIELGNYDVVEEKSVEIKEDNLIKRIEELDDGSGAPVDVLIEENSANEEKLKVLLKEGEIFQPSPGKVKIL
ncbi:hypothetical protein COV11_04725 [Candidatus Woesearchaeota archaeon CG10_big_fil_rev_8_21_14_0_10_30_7]|nr:MAG: hypothetical protein COV11_04725 [Candidatus Woesearchaeota archaeon CG10_big_fil_rev_8_21_14_0_10_30_7]